MNCLVQHLFRCTCCWRGFAFLSCDCVSVRCFPCCFLPPPQKTNKQLSLQPCLSGRQGWISLQKIKISWCAGDTHGKQRSTSVSAFVQCCEQSECVTLTSAISRSLLQQSSETIIPPLGLLTTACSWFKYEDWSWFTQLWST